MDYENEEWRDVIGYEGKYQVSNLGNVRSLSYMRTGRIKNLALHINKHGYVYVALLKDGKHKTCLVHRLVALAFIPNPDGKPCIDHINTIRNDNRVENLRWCTISENMRNPISYERYCAASKVRCLGKKQSLEVRMRQSERSKGELNNFYGKKHTEETRMRIKEYRKSETHLRKWCKPITQYDLNGNKIKDWVCAKYAEIELGIKIGRICAVLKGRKSTCGGYKWSYADDPEIVFDEYFKHKRSIS